MDVNYYTLCVFCEEGVWAVNINSTERKKTALYTTKTLIHEIMMIIIIHDYGHFIYQPMIWNYGVIPS